MRPERANHYAIERAEDRVEQLEVDVKSRRSHELIAGVGDLLGSFLGGKKDTRSLTRGAGRVVKGASSRRATSSRTGERLRIAADKLEAEELKLEELEEDLLTELEELNDLWEQRARQIESVEIGLEKTDITIDEVALLWVPVG